MRRPSLLILGLRWFLGLLFVFSGLAKLIPSFPNSMGPVDLEHQLEPVLGVVRVARVSMPSALVPVLLLTGLIAADWRRWPR